jgi:hypothetical protein
MQQQDPSCTDIRARIARVCERYVVTYPLHPCGDLTTRESVTFSVTSWLGRRAPEINQIVVLVDTCLWVHGWRANAARPVTPHSTKKRSAR